MDVLSIDQARRIALAAQGFGRPMTTTVDRAQTARIARRLGCLQIDSVNVLVRAHYLPLYSRCGPYDPRILDALAYDGKRRILFEYWAHEASLVPVELQPHLRWRMERARRFDGTWSGVAAYATANRKAVAAVLREVELQGPLAAGALRVAPAKSGWWNWSDAKAALEFLFWCGHVTTATRRNFERVYDLTERVLPARILAQPTPDEATAQRHLLTVARDALGVATERDLRDYFRLPVADARARIGELVEAGELVPVSVDGWRYTAYARPRLTVPRAVDACTLLAPFDALVWDRSRTERLFEFVYRLEIYTPKHKRVHGYYVLPFLFGTRLVARVDLKADRAAATLRVHAVHFEAGIDRAAAALALRGELGRLAGWLGLEHCAGAGWRALGRRRQ
ncbi:MAG: winged helix-turn-helix domain-containing protein [Vulcanimicrobiaceae bacterium]